VTVAFGASPPSVVLGWDVPSRLWPRISGAIVPVVNRILREAAVSSRRGLRGSVKLQEAERYRANVDVDGSLSVIFTYE
jgi:hypothetical protein